MRVYLYSTKTVQRQLQLRPPEYAEQLRQATVRIAPEGWYIDVDHPAFKALHRQYQHQPPNPNEPVVPVDVVIPLNRGSQHNDLELRYALHSIERYLRGVQQIWLVGHKPDLVEGVRHLPAEDDTPSSDRNIMRKLLLACQQEEVAEQIVFWSDDQVVLVPITASQMGPWVWYEIVPSWQPETPWEHRLKHTAELLRRKGLPTYHYDTHIPIPYRKADLRRVLEETRQEWDQGDGVCVNTWVCNHLYKPPVETVDGRKATIEEPLSTHEIQEQLQGRWFLGYNDAGFTPALRQVLDALFPTEQRWAPPQWSLLQRSAGRVPVGLLTPSLHMGGAERWLLDLVKFWDDRKLHYLGMGITSGQGHPLLFQEAERLGPIYRQYAADLWHFPDTVVVFWHNPRPVKAKHAIFVSHNSNDSAKSLATQAKSYAQFFAAVSKACAAICPQPESTTILLNGVDLDRVRPIRGREEIRKSWGIREDQVAIGYLGRLILGPHKNLLVIAEAAALAGPHVVPVFIGPKYDNRIEERLKALCPWTVLVNEQTHIGDALAALDCFVLASNYEGCSLALMEAWAAGVPTVVTPVGAVPELTEQYGSLGVSVPLNPTAEDVLQAALWSMRAENRGRVQRAQDVIRSLYNGEEFGRRWTEYLCAIHAGEVSPEQAFVPSETPVSIVTSVYNTAPHHLQECWESLKAQTWKHWEWVVVDDGSTQSATVEKLQQIAGDPRVHFIRLPEHRGIATALNIGLREARYELIARMDSDDIAQPTWLARMVAFMKTHPEIEIVGCQIEAFDDQTKQIQWRTRHPETISHAFIKSQIDANKVWFLNHPGVFYWRRKILKLGGYNVNLPAAVDLDLWLRALRHGLALVNLTEHLIRYRLHSASLVSRHNIHELQSRIIQDFLNAIR